MNKRLRCCICGADAGRWQQHWNRDDGFGICRPCVEIEAKCELPVVILELYGARGVNFDAGATVAAPRTFVATDGKWSPHCATCGGWLKNHGLATGSCDTAANIAAIGGTP